MKIDMRKWIQDCINAPVKKAMPILSFPGIQLTGHTVDEMVRSGHLQEPDGRENVVRDEDEPELSDTVLPAQRQIEEKDYQAALMTRGIPKEHIRKYGFAFCGKKVLIDGEGIKSVDSCERQDGTEDQGGICVSGFY